VIVRKEESACVFIYVSIQGISQARCGREWKERQELCACWGGGGLGGEGYVSGHVVYVHIARRYF